MRKTNLVIVDDHPMVIEGLRAIFNTEPDIRVQGTAGSAQEALAFLESTQVDIALVDINLPQVSGIELCKEIKTRFSDVMVLGMSSFRERTYISQMILAGASGFLVKTASKQEILHAVHTVLEGKLYVSVDAENSPSPARQAGRPPALTQREKEVLHLIAEGYTNHQMAEKLFISPHTVDSHRKNLLNKFEVKNTAALLNSAMKHNLLNQ